MSFPSTTLRVAPLALKTPLAQETILAPKTRFVSRTLGLVRKVAILGLAALAAPLSGQEMLMLDAESMLALPELAALAEMDGDELRIRMPLPAQQRPAANRDFDIQRGDVILMIDGKRIRDLETARSVYGAAEVGSEMAMALQRGSDRRIIRFEKMEEVGLEEMLTGGSGHAAHGDGGMVMQRLVMDGGAAPVPFPALGILGSETDDGVSVMMVLPMVDTVLEKDDLIVSLAGRAVDGTDSIKEALETLESGSEIDVKVRRAGEELTLRQTLSDAQIQMTIGGGR